MVTVVVMRPDRCELHQLEFAPGMTVADALGLTGIIRELAAREIGLAIYGRTVTPEQLLEAGDRIEVLRPLPNDPRARRRALAREGRTMGRSARSR